MPYIPPGLVAQARQMDLFAYLQRFDPDELVHVAGGEYCTKTHDSLKIPNGKWCWNSRGIAGRSYVPNPQMVSRRRITPKCLTPQAFRRIILTINANTIDKETLWRFCLWE